MYCAPAKTSKSSRSVRAQRHTDVPRTPKVSNPGHKVDKGTERRAAQQPDKTKNKKVSTLLHIYTLHLWRSIRKTQVEAAPGAKGTECREAANGQQLWKREGSCLTWYPLWNGSL
ncbi:hypothetical protein GOODEAATRI_006276 [Goodea atripinnis]|uniref:Uncharacterized protein n=1 Tax=Goodea atripinnis TaxID=208336 RepID=A0ABV0NUR8_9TELE